MPRAEALRALVSQQLEARSHADDPDVVRLTAEIRRRHGNRVRAVLLYGSYLRGRRDTLLDFYVLLDALTPAMPTLQALGNRLLPPNVYYLSLPRSGTDGEPGEALRAKYATMTLRQFERAMTDFHSYFWSRFTQPAGLVAAGPGAADRVTDAVCRAVHTFVERTVPMLEAPFSARALWQRGLGLTYACELRSETGEGIDSVYAHHASHFDALLAACAADPGSPIEITSEARFRAPAARFRAPAGSSLRAARCGWWARRVLGKLLSVLRLVKAAATFDDPLDYLLWKIQRHSGVYLEPSERQRRHPLLFAWPLLWRLYRRGAFR